MAIALPDAVVAQIVNLAGLGLTRAMIARKTGLLSFGLQY